MFKDYTVEITSVLSGTITPVWVAQVGAVYPDYDTYLKILYGDYINLPPLENRKPYASKYLFNKYPEASNNEKYIRHYYEYFYFSKKKYFKIMTLLTHFKNGGFNSAYTHIIKPFFNRGQRFK